MRSLVISIFGCDEVMPHTFVALDQGVLMIQVCDTSDLREPDYYDFRLSAPVQEHLLGEVEQLVSDLCRHHVAQCAGLQPSLFS